MEHVYPQQRERAVAWAREILSRDAVILDFETTGLRDAEIVQIGVVDRAGTPIMDTLVKPSQPIPPDATRIHGITNAMVRDAPSFHELYVRLSSLLAGKIVVAYNVSYDRGVLTGVCRRRQLPMPRPLRWDCAMVNYASFYGQWNSQRRSFTWQSLSKACVQQRIQVADAHSAVGDCLMTLRLIEVMAQ